MIELCASQHVKREPQTFFYRSKTLAYGGEVVLILRLIPNIKKIKENSTIGRVNFAFFRLGLFCGEEYHF